MKELKNGIYYVGAINPNLRVFDIIMSTEYGTSYNSYLVKGDKTALVETIHEDFYDTMLDNIKEITDPCKIDYIIMNHTEPDHSGSIAKLVKINPDITVVGTTAAIKYIKEITNCQFNSMIVKTGDKLDLGNGYEFNFIVSPFLHWPDSMFSYLANQKTIFTCDFLGCHYCEPAITDDRISYPEAYNSAFAYYYQAIFGPFKKFVLDGLNHLKKLDFDMVCTSHGPVLKNTYQTAMKLYEEFSTPKAVEKNVAIFYVSAYGYTKEAAMILKNQLENDGVTVNCYDIIKHPLPELKEIIEKSSGIMVGCPTINKDAVKPVWDLLAVTDAYINKGKPFFVFGSYGWSGEAVAMIDSRLLSLGLKKSSEPYKFLFRPNENDKNTLIAIAKQFKI